ncbi:MAG: hypothetical protein OXJ64_17725, partial [Boseongicola sp.]|nr:hypothetical protein [Boseongicola sp.]
TFRYGSLEQFDELCRRVLAGPLRQGMEERLLDHSSSFAGAHHVLKDYDGSTMAAAAEMWAERHLGMVKAERGTAGLDGTVPDGRKLQVKSKKHGAHSDAGTYITLSKSTFELADDELVVFVDDATCAVERVAGPVPVRSLSPRRGRIYVSDMIASQARAALPAT